MRHSSKPIILALPYGCPKPYVIYHHPCPDGFGAAYAAWKLLGENARYVGMSYNSPLPEFEANSDLLFLDFTVKRAEMLELSRSHGVVVIDHHVTARDDLEGIEDESSIITIIDTNHSGAYLAWRQFHGTSTMPWLIPYIEDQDLWVHKLYQTRQINAALNTYPLDFQVWDDLMTNPQTQSALSREGFGILRFFNTKVDDLVGCARRANFGGATLVPVVNAPFFFASDVGHRLLEMYPDAPFAATYRDERDGSRSWSLRSTDAREDVGALAASFGGGGHRNSSGFREPQAGEYIDFLGSYGFLT